MRVARNPLKSAASAATSASNYVGRKASAASSYLSRKASAVASRANPLRWFRKKK